MTWSAVLPLVGVVIGAFLAPLGAYLFARAKEREERRRDAYIAFLRAIADIANKGDLPNKAALIDAVRRANLEIMLYGSPQVLEKMREIIRIADFSLPEARPAFVAVVVEMRRDVGSKRFQTEANLIEATVFGVAESKSATAIRTGNPG
jgi:hypothetical protein